MSEPQNLVNLDGLDEIGKIIFSRGYQKGAAGTTPNPYVSQCKEWQRRHENAATRKLITDKIEALFEPRFITPPETAELIESILTATDARSILELGMYSGFGTLHALRAIVGKDGAKITSIDCRPSLDEVFFDLPEIKKHFEFIKGWTPDCLTQLHGRFFDTVFIDSDHSVEHCEAERLALMEITKPGSIWMFHDLPEWNRPDNRVTTPVREWVNQLVANRFFWGLAVPTCEQLDCLGVWGPGYPRECNPHLGVYIRR